MMVVMIVVVMLTVLVVVGMAVPYRLYPTVGLVRGNIMTFLVSTAVHGLLEILRPMRVVVVLAERPAVQ